MGGENGHLVGRKSQEYINILNDGGSLAPHQVHSSAQHECCFQCERCKSNTCAAQNKIYEWEGRSDDGKMPSGQPVFFPTATAK
jgi:hypothetical protein